MSNMLVDRVTYLLTRPVDLVGVGKGLARAIHVAAFTERTYVAYFENDRHDETPGFFSKEIRDAIADRLRNAHLQPEESRFRDILDWKHCNKAQLHDELRMNLLRLLREDPQPYGPVGIEVHLLLDMRMKYNASGYKSAFEDQDYVTYPNLHPTRKSLEAHSPAAAG